MLSEIIKTQENGSKGSRACLTVRYEIENRLRVVYKEEGVLLLRKMYYMALVMYYTYESWHERRWWSGSGQPDALPHPSAVDQVRAQSLEENEAVLTIFTLTGFSNTFQIRERANMQQDDLWQNAYSAHWWLHQTSENDFFNPKPWCFWINHILSSTHTLDWS